MPQYEFLCRKCRKRVSLFLSIAEYEKKKNGMRCPRCRSRKMERRWGSVYAITSKKS